MWLRIRTLKDEDFLDWQRMLLASKDSVPWSSVLLMYFYSHINFNKNDGLRKVGSEFNF
jgi:hypothetical protein